MGNTDNSTPLTAWGSERGIRESLLSPPHVALALDTSESSPLLASSPSSSRMVSIAATAGRAALLMAAGMATLCGASALAFRTSAGQSIFAMGAERMLSTAASAQHQQLLDLYTRGALLDTVQRARVFNDSKHFVDMPVKTNSTPTQILTEFKDVVQPALQANPAATNETLRAFLSKHFDEPGSEIQKTVPPDFTESPAPPLISAIENADYKRWALALHSLWKELGRSPDRKAVSSYLQPTPLASLGDTSTSTLIVVPGGRFRESYYWDSYWIVEGLMVSNMQATARRVVQNLLEYVAEYGFVPNGGRIYYLNRSQPPLLSDMVRLVATKSEQKKGDSCGDQGAPPTTPEWDLDYLRGVVPLLEKEYDYWMTTHSVPANILGVRVNLNVYNATVDSPRPESYREDVVLAEKFFPGDSARQKKLYKDIASAAESGWDFSSRWFEDQSTLATIRTDDIVPVDLNAIMYRVETNLAHFTKLLGNEDASKKYSDAMVNRGLAFEYGFWDEESSSWRDLVSSTFQKSPTVAVSNYYPLWAGAIRDSNGTVMQDRVDRAVKSLRNSGLIQVAGVETTTKTTGEQWDAPNAWPPLQDILVEGLLKADTADSRALAQELVQKWIKTNFAAWTQTGLMFEKYNATIVGGLGAGGEYVPQFGFGWTNGVVLKFLTEYKDLLQ